MVENVCDHGWKYTILSWKRYDLPIESIRSLDFEPIRLFRWKYTILKIFFWSLRSYSLGPSDRTLHSLIIVPLRTLYVGIVWICLEIYDDRILTRKRSFIFSKWSSTSSHDRILYHLIWKRTVHFTVKPLPDRTHLSISWKK